MQQRRCNTKNARGASTGVSDQILGSGSWHRPLDREPSVPGSCPGNSVDPGCISTKPGNQCRCWQVRALGIDVNSTRLDLTHSKPTNQPLLTRSKSNLHLNLTKEGLALSLSTKPPLRLSFTPCSYSALNTKCPSLAHPLFGVSLFRCLRRHHQGPRPPPIAPPPSTPLLLPSTPAPSRSPLHTSWHPHDRWRFIGFVQSRPQVGKSATLDAACWGQCLSRTPPPSPSASQLHGGSKTTKGDTEIMMGTGPLARRFSRRGHTRAHQIDSRLCICWGTAVIHLSRVCLGSQRRCLPRRPLQKSPDNHVVGSWARGVSSDR